MVRKTVVWALLFGMFLTSTLSAEERWVVKFEPEKPRKYTRDNPLGTREAYWYVVYKVTNISQKTSIDKMCLDVWISTHARYRMLLPLVVRTIPGIEGLRRDIKKEKFGEFDDMIKSTRWGEATGKMNPKYEGAGACFHDTFFPEVKRSIEIKEGRPLLTTMEINASPLNIGETKVGVAIFVDSPVEENRLYFDALNHLFVKADDRQEAEKDVGIAKLQAYLRFFPEGNYIEDVKAMMALKNNDSALYDKVTTFRARYVKSMKVISNDYKSWIKETELFGNALMHFQYFDFKAGVEILGELYKTFPKGEHRLSVERLRILAKQNLMAEVRVEVDRIRRKLLRVNSIDNTADRLYLTVSGLADTVFGWKEKRYSQIKLKQFYFRRLGDASNRDFMPLTLIDSRWIEPKPMEIRNIVHDKSE